MAKKKKKAVYNPRLKNGKYTNQHGVSFTPKQKKALEDAIREAHKEIRRLERGYAKSNPANNQLYHMGKRSFFSITPQKKNLQAFESMEDYRNFLTKQRRIASGKYLDMRTREYKKNYIETAREALGQAGDDVVNKLRTMPLNKYRELVDKGDDYLSIGYLYTKDAIDKKVENIRKALGMNPVDW